MLKYHIYLSQRYTDVYMMTSSVFYVESLRLHLTGSTSKGFVHHYGLMEKIKILFKLN
jgi:hypothetical protein